MFEPYISDNSSSDDGEDLTPGEIRMKLERQRQREEDREKRAMNAATMSACCTVVLNDKGTRIGAELWVGGGIIVTHSSFPGRPCLLTTADMVPDAYHAAHATVYFNGTVEPHSVKLASADFLVVSSDESLLDEFPPGEAAFASGISYAMVRVELGEYKTNAYCNPVASTSHSKIRYTFRLRLPMSFQLEWNQLLSAGWAQKSTKETQLLCSRHPARLSAPPGVSLRLEHGQYAHQHRLPSLQTQR